MEGDTRLSPLSALSAVDGRYQQQTQALSAYFSESALIQHRIQIELSWLKTVLPLLAADQNTTAVINKIDEIAAVAAADAHTTAVAVKQIEAETKHDVKAVEYWIGEQLTQRQLAHLCPYVHFACTSWDINNVALALQVTAAINKVLLPAMETLCQQLQQRAINDAALPMLARTHGQPASPTTVGKEFANYVARLAPRLTTLAAVSLPAKFSGAVGNYNAHLVAAADVDWQSVNRAFVEQQGLRYSPYSTQIEPYDDVADTFDSLRRCNTILLDLCRDCWGYISIEYFVQRRGSATETGSSTMPHKINPIDFENAEGNLGIANALLAHFSDKLPVSRWQRDLSDSTVLRAIGTAFGHTLIAWRAAAVGLDKIEVNPVKLQHDLDHNWAVLTEAIQTVLRAEGVENAYEQLKSLSRGNTVTEESLRAFIQTLTLRPAAKERLLALTPATYCGLAETLAKTINSKG